MPLAVFVLGLCIFCLGTTEFMISGLLPLLAKDFGVSIPRAGLLISGFALGVAIGGPPLMLAFRRIDRKRALVLLMLLFVVGQTLGALAPSYNILMAARVVTAIALGAFFGIGAVVATDLAGEARQGKAIAIMFGGLTIANVFGVPMGAYIGQEWGWRASFWIVAGLAALSVAGLIVLVPHQKQERATSLADDFRPLKRAALWPALVTTALSQAALFAVFSYLAPILTDLAGFSEKTVPPLLALFGVGTFLGSYVGGQVVDRHLSANLYVGIVALALVIALVPVAAASKISMIAVVLAFGIAGFVINPALQTQVMRVASDSPTFTSTINISAFNIGNTVGPWLGGLLISAGYGYVSFGLQY
jgi:DHA1 family inner membrane transport protein